MTASAEFFLGLRTSPGSARGMENKRSYEPVCPFWDQRVHITIELKSELLKLLSSPMARPHETLPYCTGTDRHRHSRRDLVRPGLVMHLQLHRIDEERGRACERPSSHQHLRCHLFQEPD